MLIFSIPAILSVATRLVLRRRRLWFDDVRIMLIIIDSNRTLTDLTPQGWAFFSALALLVQLGAVFTITRTKTHPFCERKFRRALTILPTHRPRRAGRHSLLLDIGWILYNYLVRIGNITFRIHIFF